MLRFLSRLSVVGWAREPGGTARHGCARGPASGRSLDTAGARRGRPFRRRLRLLCCLVCAGAFGLSASPAAAQLTVELEADRSFPETGEPVLFTATASEPDVEYEFRVDDGPPEDPDVGQPGRFTRAFTSTGSRKVTVKVSNEALESATDSVQVSVVARLQASVEQSTEQPGAPYAGEPVTFTASSTGGLAPITYRWDFDADGSIDATGPTVTRIFTTSGSHRTRLLVTDAATPQHSDTVDAETSVAPGSRPPAPTPVPTPPPCQKVLNFSLVEITTSGCFERSSSTQWTIGNAGLRLNGLPLRPASGRTIMIEEPSTAHPGGRVSSPLAVLELHGLPIFRDALALSLPAGGAGEEKTLASLPVSTGGSLFLMGLSGRLGLAVGRRAGTGAAYTKLSVNVRLPDPIRDAPPKVTSGMATPKPVIAEATLILDGATTAVRGLRLIVPTAWYGPLPLAEFCLVYTGAGQPEEPCEPITVDDKPYLECASPEGAHRWSGTLQLQVPTSTGLNMGVFASVSDGKFASVGAIRDNFGSPLLKGEFAALFGFNRLGLAICAENPFQLRGDVGVAILPNVFTLPFEIDGRVLITGPYKIGGFSVPWALRVDGSTSMFGHKVGKGAVTVVGGVNAFSLDAKINLFGVFKITGGLGGWIDPSAKTFNIEADGLSACIETVCSPRAQGIVSSTGLGACYSVGKVKIFGKTLKVRVGGGAKWSNPSDIKVVGGKCGFDRYRVARASQSSAPTTFRVGPRMPAVAVGLVGTSAPPRVRVTGPGFDVSSPAAGGGALEEGRYALIEDRTSRTTHLILVNRRAGTYRVSALDPTNAVTAIRTATPERPFAATSRVTRTRHGRRVLRMRYRKPPGTRMALVERGRQTQRTLVESARAVRCRRGSTRLCLTVRFRPAKGPGGRRTIEALLTRDGIPLDNVRVSTYRAPGQRRPGRARVRMVRRGSTVQIGWSRSPRAMTYAVAARLSDGRTLSFHPGRRCRSVRIRGVARAERLVAHVTGLREDLVGSRTTRATLRSRAHRAGGKRVRLSRSCATRSAAAPAAEAG